MRWIPFDSFSELEFIAKGGFGSVYSAKSKSWGKVALKFLDNSEELTSEFLEEVIFYRANSILTLFVCFNDPLNLIRSTDLSL